MFAKLYETEVGQILIKIDGGDKGAEVMVFFEPQGLGVCNVAFNWPELKEYDQWDNADKVFNEMTKDKAVSVVSSVLSNIM